MVLDSFMESYRGNVIIKGNDADMAAFFENVQPCSYEEAIGTFFEVQYSVEAMAAITENAILMESAGAAEMVNEGVVGSFFSAAVEKVKECATKVKQFAVAVIKKIIQFFKELYNKATPIDTIMQKYGKNPVSHSDIKTAMANGFKIPGSLKILTGDAEGQVAEIIDKTATASVSELVKMFKDSSGFGTLSFVSGLTDDEFKSKIDAIKEATSKLKEQDKELFTGIGQLLSDNDTYSKKTMFKQFVRTANADKSKDGDLTEGEWKIISDYALHGQAKMKNYKTAVEKEAKEVVRIIDGVSKEINKFGTDFVKQSNADEKTGASNLQSRMTQITSANVANATYAANRAITVMNRVVMPLMKKMHTSAISTYIYITNGTKAKNKKSDK